MADTNTQNASRTRAASKGGTTRAALLTPDRRTAIARSAAQARWDTQLPAAVCEGMVDIAGRTVACAVLETTLRVVTQDTVLTALGPAPQAPGGRGSARKMRQGGLPPFLAAANLEPFLSDEVRQAATPLVFRTVSGRKAYGYQAT